MAKAKQKQIVASVNAALPFNKEMDAVLEGAFKALAVADDAVTVAADKLHSAGIRPEIFFLLNTQDEKEMARRKAAFTEAGHAHVRKIACIARYGQAGYDLLSKPAELRPESQKEQFKAMNAWVKDAVEKVARRLQKVIDDERLKTEDAKKRDRATLLESLDEKLADLQKWVLTFKGVQDVPAADAALEIRAVRLKVRSYKVSDTQS